MTRTYEWRSAGITEMFKIRPVLKYASRKVSDPRVKNVHCKWESERIRLDGPSPQTFFAHVIASNLAPRHYTEYSAPTRIDRPYQSSKTS